jgi:SET domain-containing protein
VTLPRLLANKNEPLGHALFPMFSTLAHSCVANCRYTVSHDGRFVTVRAVRHIPKGQDLTIHYKDPLLGNHVGDIFKKTYLLFFTRKLEEL